MPAFADVFLANAQRIFDVAKSQAGSPDEQFALMIRPDGGLHLMMETTLSLEAAAVAVGAESAYLITRTNGEVRVEGRRRGERCLLEKHHAITDMLRDRPAYMITSTST